ncbi:hypothetical protein AB5V95_01060 [Metamycoplasma spumans]|uniref:hypothetical protein n=1 Tax=Metamycoplasma spumans TaxID=92406 RepID=UPI0034DCCAEC
MKKEKLLIYWTEGLINEYPNQLIHYENNDIKKHDLDLEINIHYLDVNGKLHYAFINYSNPKFEIEEEINDYRIMEFYRGSLYEDCEVENLKIQKFFFSGQTIENIGKKYQHLSLFQIREILFNILKVRLLIIYDVNNDLAINAIENITPSHEIFKKYGINYLKCLKEAKEALPNDIDIDQEQSQNFLSSVILEEIIDKLGSKWHEFKLDLLETLLQEPFDKIINSINEKGLFYSYTEKDIEKIIKDNY